MESSDHRGPTGGAEAACPSCNQLSPAGARFCNFCGQSMAPQAAKAICPRCYRDNEPGARYCNFCGAAISMDAAPNPHVAPAPAMHPYAPQQYAGYVPRSMGVGTVIGKGFGTYFRNFLPFSFIALVVCSPLLAYTLYLGNDAGPEQLGDWQGTAQLLLQGFVWILAAPLTYGTYRQLSGHHAGFGAAVVGGLRRFLPAIGVGLVSLLLVIVWVIPAFAALGAGAHGVAIVLGLVGFVPMAFMACATWVAVPVAVVERRGVLGAIKRSFALTRGNRWAVFAVFVLMYLIYLAGLFLVGIVLAIASAASETGDIEMGAGAVVGLLTFEVLFMAIRAVVAAVGYFELRSSKESVQVAELASVFD